MTIATILGTGILGKIIFLLSNVYNREMYSADEEENRTQIIEDPQPLIWKLLHYVFKDVNTLCVRVCV